MAARAPTPARVSLHSFDRINGALQAEGVPLEALAAAAVDGATLPGLEEGTVSLIEYARLTGSGFGDAEGEAEAEGEFSEDGDAPRVPARFFSSSASSSSSSLAARGRGVGRPPTMPAADASYPVHPALLLPSMSPDSAAAVAKLAATGLTRLTSNGSAGGASSDAGRPPFSSPTAALAAAELTGLRVPTLSLAPCAGTSSALGTKRRAGGARMLTDDDDDGCGSVTYTAVMPAASVAASASSVLPQLVSQDFGFVMQTRTWHVCDATGKMLQPTCGHKNVNTQLENNAENNTKTRVFAK